MCALQQDSLPSLHVFKSHRPLQRTGMGLLKCSAHFAYRSNISSVHAKGQHDQASTSGMCYCKKHAAHSAVPHLWVRPSASATLSAVMVSGSFMPSARSVRAGVDPAAIRAGARNPSAMSRSARTSSGASLPSCSAYAPALHEQRRGEAQLLQRVASRHCRVGEVARTCDRQENAILHETAMQPREGHSNSHRSWGSSFSPVRMSCDMA